MKECPICHGTCFDDMEVCYGCMHRFAEEVSMRSFADEDFQIEPVQEGAEQPQGQECGEGQNDRRIKNEDTGTSSSGSCESAEGPKENASNFESCFGTSTALTIHATSEAGYPVKIMLLPVSDLGNLCFSPLQNY